MYTLYLLGIVALLLVILGFVVVARDFDRRLSALEDDNQRAKFDRVVMQSARHH